MRIARKVNTVIQDAAKTSISNYGGRS